MQKTYYLMIAAKQLRDELGEEITGIQFEDGSGHKFNYHTISGKWVFRDLGKHFVTHIESKREQFKEAALAKDYKSLMSIYKHMLEMFSNNLASKFNNLKDLAEERGKQSVLNELFEE